jgi:hypothetical protein
MSPGPLRDILLVEDNRDDAELTIIGLKRHNLANRLMIASRGAEALELLIGSHAQGGCAGAGPAVLLRVRLRLGRRVDPLQVVLEHSPGAVGGRERAHRDADAGKPGARQPVLIALIEGGQDLLLEHSE